MCGYFVEFATSFKQALFNKKNKASANEPKIVRSRPPLFKTNIGQKKAPDLYCEKLIFRNIQLMVFRNPPFLYLEYFP